MAVTSGSNIEAADYNDLQSRINNILGNGSGTTGYGQTLASSQVSANVDNITAVQMENLRDDLNRAHQHQFNTAAPLNEIFSGNIIGADASNPTNTAGFGNVGLTDGDKGFNDYLSVMTDLEASPVQADDNQMTPEAAISAPPRTTPWNGTISHEFTVTFNNFDHRRHFFNSGGEIWFSATITGGTSLTEGTKDYDWSRMLTTMGTVKFGWTSTGATGTNPGTGTGIGNFDLTTTYQTVFFKQGSQAEYAENQYRVQARQEYASVEEGTEDPTNYRVIRFLVEFRDLDEGDQQPPVPPGAGFVGPAEDEDVGGTLTSTIRQRRATGIYVAVPTPAYSNVSTP